MIRRKKRVQRKRRPLSQEQLDLVWQYWPLAMSQADKYTRTLPPRGLSRHVRSNMADWAITYLFKRAATYKPDLCSNFATYYLANLGAYLHRQLGDHLEEFHSCKDARLDRVPAKCVDEIKRIDDREQLDTLCTAASLSTEEREYFYTWATYDTPYAMAADLKVTPQAVHNRMKRILREIRVGIGEQ